ncbi:hypothetical protein SAMN05660477_01054 [Soonwooa buanensis]|uniref:Tetratricopeptide repeat-containing protein n=2 Tax=Soonwooa buanensis TaxID=619805 RepID=A0A1T5DUZ6_9FLAO|nr:hypothetical protein SAMN05660477_01054 [Soonwooa buanensis]
MYRFFIVIVLFVFNDAFGQHQRFMDSLKKAKIEDRSRVIFGFTESDSDFLNKANNKDIFFNQVEDFAVREKDKSLLSVVELMRRKEREVMSFPRVQRDQKLRDLIKNPNTAKDPFFLGFCYHELGQIYFSNALYDKAFECDLKALEVYEKIGYEKVPNIGKILHEIALHYYFFRDYDEVIRLMKISLKFPAFTPVLGMQRYNNLGMSYMKSGKKDSVDYFFYKGIAIARQYDSDIWEGILSSGLGEYYYNQKDYKKSLALYRKDFDNNNNQGHHTTVKMNATTNMVKVYLKLDSLLQAKRYLDSSEKTLTHLEKMRTDYNNLVHIGDQQQLEIAKKLYFEVKIDYLKKTHDFRAAVQYQDSLMTIRKDIEEKYNSAVGKIASHQLTIQNKELQLLQKKEKQKRQQLYYLASIFAFLTASGIGIFYLYKSKQKKIRQNEILISENKINILEKREAEKELERAKAEIFKFVNKANEHNAVINQLEKELVQLKSLKSEQRSEISDQLQNLKSMKILTDDDWFNFQRLFEAAFPDVMRALKLYSSRITASEMRYLMLSKLELNNKEMAKLLGVSDAAMRVVWNRLRKKLNLSLEDTPLELIKRICEEQHDVTMLN